MRSLTVYYSKKTPEQDILEQVKQLCESLGIFFVDINIDNDLSLQERYGLSTPVVMVGPYRINSPFTMNEVEIAIRATLDQEDTNEKSDERGKRFNITKYEKFAYWFSRSYAWVISLVILIFTACSILPALFANNGNTKAASFGYKFYSVLCHQLAFRSYFLFGEQFFYPRQLAGIGGISTYETVTGVPAEDIEFARAYIGDQRIGYKIALCQRDVAIYLSLCLFGFIFEISGKKIKTIHWYSWFLIAIFPIALDGFSQLPSLAEGWPAWFPIRESTPIIRTITGFLFGAGTGWYVYPMMEESIRETRFTLARKISISNKFFLKK